jgi:hypothetical protein
LGWQDESAGLRLSLMLKVVEIGVLKEEGKEGNMNI